MVKLFFGGQVSADTRQVLMSGENPLMSSLPPDTSMTGRSDDPAGRMAPGRPPLGGGRGRGQVGPVQTTPIALQGLQQVIGLALGAPEFQRR